MRSASSLNFSPMYFSTCGRLTMLRLTFFLIGKPVSLLAKCRISSTDRKSSFASAGVIWWIVSTGSISKRCEGVAEGCACEPGCGDGAACGLGEGCGGIEGCCCAEAVGVAEGGAFCANPNDR